MAMHGSASRGKLQRQRSQSKSIGRQVERIEAIVAPADMAGFRHFIETPSASECFTFQGIAYDPTNDAIRGAANTLMRKVARRLEREPPPPPKDPNDPLLIPDFDNPGIPAGYTYVFQLMAHDLVHSSAFLSLAEGRLADVSNTRTAPLRLETVYGDGPAARPDLYDRVEGADASRFPPRLRVGPLRTNVQLGIGDQATLLDPKVNFDIARAGCPFANGHRGRGLAEAIIGDPRNDDHPILSQLVVLVHHLHNYIHERVARDRPPMLLENPYDRDHRNFMCARAATTLIYRNIVRQDVLARLLQRDVYQAYDSGRAPVVDARLTSGQRWSAPFELTHGVMRAAHGMIRPNYTFNAEANPEEFNLRQMLRQSSDDQPIQMPLQRKWALDWRNFFGANAVNKARRFRPHYDAHLFDPEVFPAEAGEPVEGLAYRDHLSAIDGRPWSIGALAARLRKSHPELLAKSRMFAQTLDDPEAQPWAEPLALWLARIPARLPADAFTADEITRLSRDPPLPLFFLFEAEIDTDGAQLGVLGSIILADVVYSLLRNAPLLPRELADDLPANLATLSDLMFEGAPNVLGFITEPRILDTFDDLLAFMRADNRMPEVF